MEQALTNGAAGAAPSTLELLLRADVVSVKANMPTARYEISRLSEPCPTAGFRSSNA